MVTAQSIKLQRQRLLKVLNGLNNVTPTRETSLAKTSLQEMCFFLNLMLDDIVEQINTPDYVDQYNSLSANIEDVLQELINDMDFNIDNLKQLYLQARDTPVKKGFEPFFPTHFITVITTGEKTREWLKTAKQVEVARKALEKSKPATDDLAGKPEAKTGPKKLAAKKETKK